MKKRGKPWELELKYYSEKKTDAFPKKMNFQFHQIYLLLNHQEKKIIITSQTSIKESQG